MEPTDMMQMLYFADMFKLLGDKTRLTIMALLQAQSMCVRDLVMILQASQPSVSQHLAKLKTHGLVRENRRGPWVFYSVNNEIAPMMQVILKELPDVTHMLKNRDAVLDG